MFDSQGICRVYWRLSPKIVFPAILNFCLQRKKKKKKKKKERIIIILIGTQTLKCFLLIVTSTCDSISQEIYITLSLVHLIYTVGDNCMRQNAFY